MSMVHLHLHTSYSALDAISKPSDVVRRAIEYGHPAIALTDHGTIAGIPEFYNECVKQSIKPILGSEFYMMPDCAKAREEKDRKNYHLILLAMDMEGWSNIMKLTTKANEKFYYAPRIDYDDLREHSNGLICMTACLKGIVNYHLAEEKYDEAQKHAMILHNIFGDRLYMEVQDGGLDIQIPVNEAIRRMAKKLGVKTVATNDSHYIDRNDVEAHEAIWAIRTGHSFDDPIGYGEGRQFRPYYRTREHWFKDFNDMLGNILTENNETRRSTVTQEELEATLEIADRIGDVKIEKGRHLPKYEYVNEICCGQGCCGSKQLSSFDALKRLVFQGYEKVYENKVEDMPKEHSERLDKELADISDAGLADYFLIVWDVINWARNNDIAVGPGRGSAAGSMVSFCLGITEIDPLKYGLIWERFYNAGRKGSLADIDMDFSKRRRGEVIEYIKSRFGADRVAQMVTFNTLGAKAALKDTAKVLGKQGGMEYEDANVMTRFVGSKPGIKISKALENSEKLQEYRDKFPRLFKIAKTIEGCPKSRGVHAAGVIISDKPFDEGFPLRWNTKEKCLITEWDGETLDGMGFLKLDILGLKTLDVLKDIEDEVRREANG